MMPTQPDQPTPASTEGRYICTESAPWTKEKGRLAAHPDSVHIRDVYDDSADHNDYEIRRCPYCGLTFESDLPN